MTPKLLIIDCAALSWQLVRDKPPAELCGLTFRPADAIFPAVTCTAQAAFRTRSTPCHHGMVANGLYFRHLAKVMFWEQSAGLVQGRRFWEGFRNRGGRVGMMFWQQSLGEDVDLLLSPAPIHKHHGGMIQDCYSHPSGLYKQLRQAIGAGFKLRNYWGPLASAKVADWIARAVAEVLARDEVDLLLTYLPSLDYDLQRYGPDHPRAAKALDRLLSQLQLCLSAARDAGYQVLIFGDYAITPTRGPAIYPNRFLLERGWLSVRNVGGMLYPDLYASRAFAMVDHEIAHIYVRHAGDVPAIKAFLEELAGIEEVLIPAETPGALLDHPNAGELVAVAEEGKWLAYPWWSDKRQAPDYARHIDIHNKPGFDPCELMFGWPPGVTTDTERISGSHGRTGAGREIAWASTLELPESRDLLELATHAQQYLDGTD
jgi:predicted AlkP superfamily pyrophosphatase or phosphodiesterase